MRTAFVSLLLLAALAGLASAQADRLTLDQIKTLIDVGIDEGEIISRIRRVKRVEIKAEDIDALQKAGASKAILDALRSRLKPQATPLIDRVLDLLKKKVEEEKILLQVLSQPQRVQLSIDDALRLREAGATKRILRALRGNFVFNGYSVHKHPFNMFEIQHLKGWKVQRIRRFGGLPTLVISPETGFSKEEEVTTGVLISWSPLNPWSKWAVDLGVVPVVKRLLEADLHALEEQNPRLLGDKSRVAATTLAGYPAAFNQIDVTRRGVECRRMHVQSFLQGDVHIWVELVAPVDKFERVLPVFLRMLASLRAFTNDQTPIRRDTPVDRGAVLDRYRESVVMVKAYFDGGFGYGTGFFVREDGYVLTNQHVVHHNGKPAKKIEVIWDSEVAKDEGKPNRILAAQLIDSEKGDWPLVDIAVLKVAKGKWSYKPIPLSPLGSGTVMAEDAVIALGFPYPDSFGKVGRLITTNGHISRINRLADVGSAAGMPDDIVLDITINKGNSGGPCIDLRTGAVVGLNTQVVLAPGMSGGVEKLEYGRVCLVDHALKRFPQLRWYPKGRAMAPSHHTDLAEALITWGNYPAARRELDAVATMSLQDQDRARFHFQSSRYESFAGDSKKQIPLVKKAVEAHPEYPYALDALASHHALARRYDEALKFTDRMRRAQPRVWRAGYSRAWILQIAGRLDEALAAIDRELGLGASYHPQPWILKSNILLSMKDAERAERALRDGLAQAPHYETRVALANHMATTRKQPDEAQRLFEDAVRRHPAEPRVHEAYGLFLHKNKRSQDTAIKHMQEAITLDRQRGGRPGRATLDVIYEIGKPATSKYGKHALQAALLIAERWPTAGRGKLRDYWSKRKQWALANAHGTSGGTLRLVDLDAMAAAQYPPIVFSRTVFANGLNVNFFALIAHLKKKETRWTNWQLNSVLVKYERDQLYRSKALPKLIGIKGVGGVTRGKTIDYTTYALTNKGKVPLTDIWLKVSYLDKNKKVLFAGERSVPPSFLPLNPGETRTYRYYFHGYDYLKSKGVDVKKIYTWSSRPELARNATFLTKVTVVETSLTRAGYKFKIKNPTAFKLKQPSIRCDFTDNNGKVIQYPGKPPIVDGVLFRDTVVVPAKGKSVELNVTRWGDVKFLTDTLGLPTSLKGIKMRLRVVNALPVR